MISNRTYSLCCQKFFQFLGHYFKVLQSLTQRVPESALQRWEDVVNDLQGEAARLQQLGLEKGTRMQETLEVMQLVCLQSENEIVIIIKRELWIYLELSASLKNAKLSEHIGFSLK